MGIKKENNLKKNCHFIPGKEKYLQTLYLFHFNK